MVVSSSATSTPRSPVEDVQPNPVHSGRTLSITGCKPVHHRLEPYASQAATPRIAGVANSIDFYPRPHTLPDHGCAQVLAIATLTTMAMLTIAILIVSHHGCAQVSRK